MALEPPSPIYTHRSHLLLSGNPHDLEAYMRGLSVELRKRDEDIRRALSLLEIRGEISAKDNATPMTLNSAAKVQVTIFDTNGSYNNTVPDHTNDHIIIQEPGVYFAIMNASIHNNAAQAHVVDLSLWKNNGATEYGNVHTHRSLSGGSTDAGAIPAGGLIQVDEGDTLEVWLDTSVAADRSVTVEDITLTVFWKGT